MLLYNVFKLHSFLLFVSLTSCVFCSLGCASHFRSFLLHVLSRFAMKSTSLFICLLTIYSATSAAVIPLRGVYAPKNILGRSEARAYERAHARSFAKRQDPIPSDSIQSTVPVSQLSSTSSPVTVSPTSLVSNPASSSSPTPTSVAASATAPPTPEISQPPADSDGSPKLVVAHHMVGNTFPYTLQDWIDDITLAHASGIDGFALNMGSDPWQPNQVANA